MISIPKSIVLITGIFLFCSPCLAASDEELGHIGDKMSGAFRCATYAGMFQDWKEQQRLFGIGVKAGRDFVEGIKSRDDSSTREMVAGWLGASTDFVVGATYDSERTYAYDEIAKYEKDTQGIKNQAELAYRKSNCSLIQ